MSETRIEMLFVDTSCLRACGVNHPDLRKLMLRSQNRSLRIVVSEIALDEWRTWLRDNDYKKVASLRTKFEELKEVATSHPVFKRLAPLGQAIWEDADIDAASKAAMSEYVSENRIEVIPIAADHGERVWRRYFHVKIEPPFKNRENRRNDIPDAWIFEAAQDLLLRGQRFAALCGDNTLSAALERIGVRVFRTAGDLVRELERLEAPPQAPALEPGTADMTLNPLPFALGRALDPFRVYEEKALGFVAYLGSPSKQELLDWLKQSGIPEAIAINAIDRLVLMKLLRDTGHHYLVADRTLAAPAASVVEGDVIRLLSGGGA